MYVLNYFFVPLKRAEVITLEISFRQSVFSVVQKGDPNLLG